MFEKKLMPMILLISVALAVLCLCNFGIANPAEREKLVPQKSSVPTAVTVTRVKSQDFSRQIRIPGEIQAYQDVALYAKIPGFVEAIHVDRGSVVRQGQLLVQLSAPELTSQRAQVEALVKVLQSQTIEMESKLQAAKAQCLEAEARLAAEESIYRRLKKASETPGVVAGNDVEQALRTMEVAKARVEQWRQTEKAAQAQVGSFAENEKSARATVQSVEAIQAYLRITAPFSGVITERNVHKGSFTGQPGSAGSLPILRIQDISRLRLVVPLPESEVGAVTKGTPVQFTVRAFPGVLFIGNVQRIGQSVDVKTRTMPIEIDVFNRSGKLTPGMFPEVIWPSRRSGASLFVPPTAIVTTTERMFVIRVRDGQTEWVDVKRGQAMENLVEVRGGLAPGELVVLRASDELRAGTKVDARIAKPAQ